MVSKLAVISIVRRGRMFLERGELRLDGAGRLASPLGEVSAIVRPWTVIRRSISSKRPLIVSVRLPTSREMRSATSPPRPMTSSKAARRGAQRLLHLARAGVDGGRQGLGGAVERFVDARALRRDGEDDVLAGAGEAGMRLVGLAGERFREFLAAGFVGGLELVDLGADERGDALADLRRLPSRA